MKPSKPSTVPLRCYRAARSFRLRDRVLWAGDKIVLREDIAAEHLRVGDLVPVEPTTRTSWGEPMLTR